MAHDMNPMQPTTQKKPQKKDKVKVCELKEGQESTIIRHRFHGLTQINEKSV